MKKTVAAVAAALVINGCSIKTAAWDGQRMVTLPGDGLRRLNSAAIEAQLGGAFEQLAVTLQPVQAALYLDGAPLQWGRTLSREEVERVFLFSAEKHVSLGVLPIAHPPLPERPRIRCINPFFPGDTNSES